MQETGISCREMDMSRINFVGMPTDGSMVTSNYQVIAFVKKAKMLNEKQIVAKVLFL